ncbi:MAG TPA: response regulator [Pedobacter sp.]|jgi:CheY-like chemotaxis protein
MLDKILFVDDDHIALVLNQKLVEKTNFAKSIVTASNGELALEYFSKLLQSKADPSQYPQFIFLDLNMPIMDGWEFLTRFSEPTYDVFRETKIVVLSSSINPQDLARSKNYDMVIDFISKPITAELLEKLGKLSV